MSAPLPPILLGFQGQKKSIHILNHCDREAKLLLFLNLSCHSLEILRRPRIIVAI